MRTGSGLRHVVARRDFRRLLGVRLLSQTGDGSFQLALASFVLFSPERQPSPEAIAAAFAALLLPFSLLGPFAGVLLDRWSRQRVLWVSNAGRAGLVLALAALVGDGGNQPLLFAGVVVCLSVNRFVLAALSAALPHVVEPADLVTANALTPTAGTFAFLLGLGAGGVVRGLVGSDAVVMLVASALYAAAAVATRRIAGGLLGPDFDPGLPAVREAVGHVFSGLRDGIRHLRTRRPAAAGLAAVGAHRFFYGVSTVATILLYRNYFHPGDLDAGFAGLTIAVLVSGAGFVCAAVVTPAGVRRVGKRRWIVGLLLLAAVVEVVPGAFYTEPSLLLAAFVLGVSAQGVKVCVDTLVQEWVDDPYRGRVFSVYDVLFNVAFVAAASFAAVVLPVSGHSYPVVGLVAAGYAGTALAYHLASRRPLQRPAPLGRT